jgi:hypothetical protein
MLLGGGVTVDLQLDLGSVMMADSFNYCTANDVSGRDPGSWVVQGSLDGASWYEMNRQDAHFSTVIDGVQVSRKTCLPVRFALELEAAPSSSGVLELEAEEAEDAGEAVTTAIAASAITAVVASVAVTATTAVVTASAAGATGAGTSTAAGARPPLLLLLSFPSPPSPYLLPPHLLPPPLLSPTTFTPTTLSLSPFLFSPTAHCRSRRWRWVCLHHDHAGAVAERVVEALVNRS